MLKRIIQEKLTPKNSALFLIILLFPLLTFGLDAIAKILFTKYAVPLPVSGGALLRIAVLVWLSILLSIGLNIVCGFTGMLDLGYVVFYLVGGYTAGILMTRLGWSYWFVLPLATLNGALWGLLRGAPTLRLTGDYFAIVTFGFAELLFRVVKNEEWLLPKGRENGQINDVPPPTIFGIELYQMWHHYYHILILVGVVTFVTYRLLHSRVGRAWVAIREDEQAAESMGINVSRYKSLAFAVSAAIGALAGAFFAPFQVSFDAGAFEFWQSILILCMVVLGGMGSIRGAIIGGAVLGALGEVLRSILPYFLADARYLIFGIILVLLMRFRPGGLIYKKA